MNMTDFIPIESKEPGVEISDREFRKRECTASKLYLEELMKFKLNLGKSLFVICRQEDNPNFYLACVFLETKKDLDTYFEIPRIMTLGCYQKVEKPGFEIPLGVDEHYVRIDSYLGGNPLLPEDIVGQVDFYCCLRTFLSILDFDPSSSFEDIYESGSGVRKSLSEKQQHDEIDKESGGEEEEENA